MKINKVSLGLALGILWGACVFVATLWIAAQDGGDHLIVLANFYFGYSVSFVGALVGLVYGFVDGFIGGWLIGLLYNAFDKSTP
ncbi:MAG: hypothetical protein V1800_16050 [Candidatus Latescibacterota bacterium]